MEGVGKLRVDKEYVSAKIVAAGAHLDKLNYELALQRTDLEISRVTLSAKTDFIELSKGRMAAKEASVVQKRKEFEAKHVKARPLLHAVLTELTAQLDRLSDEVDHISSVRGMLSVEMKKDGRELTRARAEIICLAGQVTTHKRSAEKAERPWNYVQYELDGALI